MEKLNFIVKWDGNRERSWSGTNYGIYKALSDYYDIVDYDISPSKFDRILARIFRNINALHIHEIKQVGKSLSSLTGKVFQFAEILDDSDDRQTYIYQDLSVEYLLDLHEHDSYTYSLSGFGHVSYESIVERNKMQQKYYKNAHGIFTMGQWLAEYFKKNHPDYADKVHHVGGVSI